jgi:hypothetical protein
MEFERRKKTENKSCHWVWGVVILENEMHEANKKRFYG